MVMMVAVVTGQQQSFSHQVVPQTQRFIEAVEIIQMIQIVQIVHIGGDDATVLGVVGVHDALSQ